MIIPDDLLNSVMDTYEAMAAYELLEGGGWSPSIGKSLCDDDYNELCKLVGRPIPYVGPKYKATYDPPPWIDLT